MFFVIVCGMGVEGVALATVASQVVYRLRRRALEERLEKYAGRRGTGKS